MMEPDKPDPSDIPEFDRVMRGLVGVDPAELSPQQERPAMAQEIQCEIIHPTAPSRTITARAHLCEQQVRGKPFWFGVVEIDTDDLTEPLALTKGPARMTFEDGRFGGAYLAGAGSLATADIMETTFIGYSELQK